MKYQSLVSYHHQHLILSCQEYSNVNIQRKGFQSNISNSRNLRIYTIFKILYFSFFCVTNNYSMVVFCLVGVYTYIYL